VQSHSLNPIEEGLAFKKYVHDFGWGGISELAQKFCKSPSYVSRRIKLVNLPQDILDLISQSAVNITTVEELLPITANEKRSMLTELILDKHLFSRTVRKLVQGIGSKKVPIDSIFCYIKSTSEYERISKSFDKAIVLRIVLRIAIKRLATIIEKLEDKWMFYDILIQHKHILPHQVDLLLKEKTKYEKKYLLLQGIN
jgi:ParB family transcriptional regulator, chromosome partitioning protein